MSEKWDISGLKGVIRRLGGLVEIVLLAVLYYVIWRNFYEKGLFPGYLGKGKYVLCLVYGFIVLILLWLSDGFEFGYSKLTDIIIAQCVSLFVANFITYFQLCLIANQMIRPWPILVLFVLDCAVCFACCCVLTAIYHRVYVPKNMLLIYGNESALDLKFKMDMRRDKYHISRVMSIDEGVDAIIEQIPEYDAVIINDIPAEVRNDILKYCYMERVRTYVVPKLSDIVIRGAQDITLFDTPLFLVKGKGLSPFQRLIKRAFDIVLCSIAIIPAAPVMAIIALAIKLEDHGPVFYRQERVTQNGKTFRIFKFRSMVVNAESYGTYSGATENDPRITKVGRVIRAVRLDELPQIFNILMGDMSIVGPRPEHKQNHDTYVSQIPEFSYRLKVKGGLTGYAQIYGKYNTSAYDKLRLDLIYIENYSLLLDIKLILLTVSTLFKKESTEGFEKQAELEQLRRDVLREKADTVHKG